MGTYVKGSLWFYAPNKGAPIAFIVLFAVSGVWHIYQTLRYKSWRATALMPWAATLMVAGFALREAGAYHLDNLDLVIASNVLVLSGPPVYAAVNYLVFSRVLFYVPYLSPIHPGRVATTFLALDGVCEAVLANGAVRVSNSSLSYSQRKAGEDMLKAALILQAVMFVFFVALVAQFHRRAKRARVLKREIRTVLIVLYISSGLITARCIYRVVEFFQGYTGHIFTHEPYFWVFEASIMWLNSLLLNIWHPGRYLPRSNTRWLSKDGVTELRGPGWEDKRNFLLTLFDPFDILGLVMGRDKKNRFWEMDPAELEAQCIREKQGKAARRTRRRRRFAAVFGRRFGGTERADTKEPSTPLPGHITQSHEKRPQGREAEEIV